MRGSVGVCQREEICVSFFFFLPHCWLAVIAIPQSLIEPRPTAVKMRSPNHRTSLVAQLVKNLLAMQETWVQSLGWEDPLEKGKATHSSILAWRTAWTV